MAGEDPQVNSGLPVSCRAGTPPADGPVDARAEPRLEEIIEGNFRDVGREEWNNLPRDLTDRLDHYLYGADR